MKKILTLAAMFALVAVSTQAQEIFKGLKNQASLVKGSRALPTVKYKDGFMVGMSNTDDGMAFTMTKNGKNSELFDGPVDAKYGQAAEADVDGDGKNELLAGYRKTENDFTINIYKKPEFEFEYKLWATVNGTGQAEFPQDGTVKLYTKEGSVNVMKFDSEGKLTQGTK